MTELLVYYDAYLEGSRIRKETDDQVTAARASRSN